MDKSSLQHLMFSMTALRSDNKMERYRAVKRLLSALLTPIEEHLHDGFSPGGFDEDSPYMEMVRTVITTWQEIQKGFPSPPVRFPSQVLFQEFAMALYSSSKGFLLEDTAFNLGAWLEEKFTAGRHPFWSRFLERAVLHPLNIDPGKILPYVFLPVEGILHTCDDYIDTGRSTPYEAISNIGFTAITLVLLPLLFRSAIPSAEADNSIIMNGCHAFYSAFKSATVMIPQIEDETPGMLRKVRGNMKEEIEAAGFNIDFRTRATTGVFLQPLSSLFPHHGKDIQLIWDMLWLARATEMCVKDALFDVESDILNRDYTPASVWAEDFGVETDEWCIRIEALYNRYLGRWGIYVCTRSIFSEEIFNEIETRIHKNRFLINSIINKKETDLPEGLKKLKKVYMVGSGKGGVGKSTISWLIANGLHKLGQRVGVIDADIWGPSQDILFQKDGLVSFNNMELVPEDMDGITLVTLGQFVKNDDAILMRSTIGANLLKQLILSTRWPELDYLIVDLPPGASDIHIQLCNIFPQAEIILVTLSQPLAIADTSRTLSIYMGLNKTIKGLVINMTDIMCSNCGKENPLGNRVAEENGERLLHSNVPLLARLPFDVRLVDGSLGCITSSEDGKGNRLGNIVDTMVRSLIS